MNGKKPYPRNLLPKHPPGWKPYDQRARCRVKSPATARRCTLGTFHASDHERRSRSGRLLEQWPRAASDADHQPTCTSAELIGHLSDLIELAKWEGFGAMVGELERAKRTICGIAYVRKRGRRMRPPSLFGLDRGARH